MKFLMKGSIPVTRHEPISQNQPSQTDNAVFSVHGTDQLSVPINTDKGIHFGGGFAQRSNGSYLDQGLPFQAVLQETNWNWQAVIGQPTSITLNAVNLTGIEITFTYQGGTLAGNTTGSYTSGTFFAQGASYVWTQ